MNSVTYITLDLQAPNFAVVASAKQNDTLGRQIAATLRDGSVSFDATGLLCEIRYAKPDGTVGFYDTLEDNETPAYSIDGNVVTFTLAEQMLTIAGAVYVDVNFYAPTGEKLTAFTFTLNVEASVLADGTIVSSDYYNVLTATLAEAAAIAANLPQPSDATPLADSANGSAGTGNGFSRGNHSHPLNVADSGTPANLGTPANGASTIYARQDHVHDLTSVVAACLLAAHPVGSYYWSDSNTDPATFFGGTWVQIKDTFVLAAGDTYAAGATGGEASHTLTSAESGQKAVTTAADGSHSHTITTKFQRLFASGTNQDGYWGNGSGGANTTMASAADNGSHTHTIAGEDAAEAHNNMPPYVVAYCWKRTA